MSNSQNFLNVLIILSLPFQFSFHLNYYTVNGQNIQHDWDYTKITDFQLEVAERITSYFAAISSIIWIFASYKIRKRRLPIMINFIIGGVVWLLYILINDETLWLAIILRAINGVLLGFFQSVHISYMMHFVEKDLTCFHGCLIQFTMFLSLCTLYILTYNLPWIPVCIILSVQSFAFAGLIWFVPEAIVYSKSSTNHYIYKQPNLKNLIIMLLIMFVQCFSGIGFMIDNCARLMSSIGINMDHTLQSILVYFVGCLSTFIASLVMDIMGIHNMWAISTFGMVISLVIYDLNLKIAIPNWIGVFSVFLYFLFFGLGSGPIPWLLCGAIFHESVMIESGCITCFMNRFMDIWFGYLLTEITKYFGEFGSVIFNAAFSFAGCLFGLFFIPKLKNVFPENTTII